MVLWPGAGENLRECSDAWLLLAFVSMSKQWGCFLLAMHAVLSAKVSTRADQGASRAHIGQRR